MELLVFIVLILINLFMDINWFIAYKQYKKFSNTKVNHWFDCGIINKWQNLTIFYTLLVLVSLISLLIFIFGIS